MKRIERNLQNGETIEVELTAEEVAEFNIGEGPATEQQQRDARSAAYRKEADPLFFKAQRGEATADEWTAKVAEIKARYPYPEA